MKQGFQSLTQLAAELERQSGAKQDFIAPAASIVATVSDGAPRLAFAGALNAPMTQHARRQLDEYLGIPAKYSDRMLAEAPELWALSAAQWLDKKNGDRRMVRMLDGNVRAFLSDRYQRIDNYEVAEVALAVLKEVSGLRIVSTNITESRLYIKAVSSEVRGEVKSKRVGDFVEAGVMISNSEIGMGAVSIKPFANFLVCTNGMVRDKATLRAAHVGRKQDETLEGLLSDETKRLEDEVVLRKVRDILRLSFDAADFQRWIETLSEQADQPIRGDAVGAVEQLGQSFGFSQAEKSGVLRNLIEGGDLSRYGLINAVTRLAEDVPSYDRATELEEVGGRIVTLSNDDWFRVANAEPVRVAA